MPTTAPALAAKIRSTRAKRKMTQKQFANHLGIRQQKLSEWENGKRLRGVLEGLALIRVFGGKKFV